MAKTAAISLTKLVLTCGLISEFLRTVITQGQESLVNIARNKSANQIGAYGGATADRAIDGRLDQSIGGDTYLNVCAFADTTWDNNVPANWKLDLKAVYRIADVVIYNTYHDTGDNVLHCIYPNRVVQSQVMHASVLYFSHIRSFDLNTSYITFVISNTNLLTDSLIYRPTHSVD
ncbi:hypothetical protein LSH36_1254g00035 [Paralvinella palmiformis]|uniref:Uncharacterized protein n=1 Tax=Paralvinella palmiformis TaxID=53620 RepID=A0AAD9MQW3_9ANNE|nr:hypothetical protein LSH36_1254g00035 [Paralvinella palmiformis]